MNKLIVICGKTATGKTKLGLHVAKMLNGEIVSADSRQIYKYMDIGTGKDVKSSNKVYIINGISIWGLDLVKPNQEFSVAHWVKFSTTRINDIWNRNKLPIIVGGSGFWIKTLIDGVDSMGIPPNWELRKRLSKSNIDELVSCLKKINPIKYEQMNNSDRNNPRRLIRAIEIAYKTKNQIPNTKYQVPSTKYQDSGFKINEILMIGLKADNKKLDNLIDQMVERRICEGAEQEVRQLVKKGYNFDLQVMQTPGYKEWKNYFDKKIDLNEVIKQWKNNEHKLARNQLTWFKKDKRIIWFDIEKSNHKEIANYILRWYTEKR